jgi:nucleoporin NDC1
MWSQIYMICLTIISGLENRVDNYGKPPPPLPVTKDASATEQKTRVAAPLKEDPIFQTKPTSKTMRGEVEKVLGQVARSPGHSPVSQLSPLAKKTLRNAKDRVLSKEQQEALSPPKLKGQLHQWALIVLHYNIPGMWFRQGFRRRFNTAVLGTPYAEPSLYVHAATVLSLLSVHSLAEDKFGNVHRDVPTIVRTFTAVIRKLEAFKQGLPVHWTDISQAKATPEVDQVLDALKTGLAQVVSEFEPYSADLRLSLKDVRLAKEAAAKPVEDPAQEMEEVR